MPKLSTEAALHQLSALPLWTFDSLSGAVTREFVLRDFSIAFEFMRQIAVVAEQENHHPEWLNIYNKVTIKWTTHDAAGLTEKDIQMSQVCEEIYNRLSFPTNLGV